MTQPQQSHRLIILRLLRRRIISIVVVLLTVLATVTFITVTDHQQRKEAEDHETAQRKEFAAIDARVKAVRQKKIDDARRAEAEAKARADADAAVAKAQAAIKPAGAQSSETGCTVTNPISIAVVINKKHCFTPIDWAPSDLVSINGYPLRSEAATQLRQLMDAMAAASLPLDISSAYRSYANQQATYAHWVTVNGSQAAADTVSARPGYSEHQTGLAVDLKAGGCALECFGSTAQYAWLTEHAADYGFIRRYPDGLTSITGYSPESWHWRYVGISTAKDMKAKNIQTMEQYFGVSGGDYQ